MKTSSSFDDFSKQIFNFKYHVQAFIYKTWAYEMFKENYKFRWIVVDSSPPHDVRIFEPDDYMMERAEEDTYKALKLFLDWQNSNFKKHEQTEPELIGLPGWV